MKMLNNYLWCLTASFCLITSLKAQNTGIGTHTPHSSAILEVSSQTIRGGVLLPKVNLKSATDVVTIPNPTTGLMVYNTNDAGTHPNKVEADHHYFWNGTRWTDLADINIIKNLLLPQVFFCQETAEQGFTSSSLSAFNNGGDIVVTFLNANVLTNNGNNVTLLPDSRFRINHAGEYEISGFINYNPRVDGEENTNLLYKLQKSVNGGASWITVGQTTSVWGRLTGGFSRTLIAPPTIIQFNANDLLRVVISKSFGSNHGSSADISLPGGLTFTKNIRILKLD